MISLMVGKSPAGFDFVNLLFPLPLDFEMLGSDFSYRSGNIKDPGISVVRSIEHEENLYFSFQKVRTFRPHMKSLIRLGRR